MVELNKSAGQNPEEKGVTSTSKITLYRHPLSGHAHRAELFLSLLGLDAQLIDVDLMTGAHKQEAFLARNRFGQVPVLEDDGDIIADVANYAYIAHAPEGDVALEPYPNVLAWLSRIAALPGFVPMQRTEVGLAA